MKEYGSEQGSSVQNRFTAYLVTAVKNKRISYMEKKHQQMEFETERLGILERSYTDFEQEYRQYKLEHLPWKYNETPSIEQLIRVLEEGKLIGAIIKLKKREQEILIARVFEELDFKEIGTRMEMSEKQAEMAYYYIIRKIRKELEGKRYE